MADSNDPQNPSPRKDDTAEYSASKAPETRQHAEERDAHVDPRLIPGGAHGSHADVGMSGMDRETVPSRALKPEERDYGRSPSEKDV